MMKQCKQCVFKDEIFDRLHQSDVIVEGEEPKEEHFCLQYREGIPTEIIEDEAECDFMVKE